MHFCNAGRKWGVLDSCCLPLLFASPGFPSPALAGASVPGCSAWISKGCVHPATPALSTLSHLAPLQEVCRGRGSTVPYPVLPLASLLLPLRGRSRGTMAAWLRPGMGALGPLFTPPNPKLAFQEVPWFQLLALPGSWAPVRLSWRPEPITS